MAAYHAFANVLLFYRLCRTHGIAEQRECDRQESILRPWLEKLEGPLLTILRSLTLGEHYGSL